MGKNLMRDRGSYGEWPGGADMECAEERRANFLILKLEGRLDTATADGFEERLLALIDGGERQLIIDCAGVEYVSSAGLRAFLQAAKRLRNTDGKILLHSLNANLRQVFDVSGFSMIFRIFASEEEAIRGLMFTGLLPRLR
jgi:anti-anti-sigma factor